MRYAKDGHIKAHCNYILENLLNGGNPIMIFCFGCTARIPHRDGVAGRLMKGDFVGEMKEMTEKLRPFWLLAHLFQSLVESLLSILGSSVVRLRAR